MTKLEVFDPPMCCSSGVCGPKVDPVLPRFAADLEWMKSQGVAVSRYNLAQLPGKPGEKTRRFEIKQGMNEAPLTKHPETGEPIRRVILGGYGILRKSTGVGSAAACGCGKNGCCR